MNIDDDLRLKRFADCQRASNTISHGLTRPRGRFLGVSGWVWNSAAVLAGALWTLDMLQGLIGAGR